MLRWWALVVALAAATGACGDDGAGNGTDRVAFSQVEVQAYLEREVARTLPGLAVGAASCPSELPDRNGGVATCTIVVERTILEYEVQRLVGERFEARPSRPIVLVRDIAAAVRSKLEAPAAEVRCDDALVVQPAVDQPLTCEVTGQGPPRPAIVQVGPDGTVTVTGS